MHLPVLLKLLLSELKLVLKMHFLLLPDLLLFVDTSLVKVDYFLKFLLILGLHFLIVFFAKLLIYFVLLVVLEGLGLGPGGLDVDFLQEAAVLRLELVVALVE